MEQTKQMLEICQTLKNEYFDYQKKQIESDHISKRRMKEQNIITVDMTDNNPSKKTQPNLAYFGKKPFSYGNQAINDPFDNVNTNVFQSLGEGVSVNLNYENNGIFNNERKKIIPKKNTNQGNQVFKTGINNNQRQSYESNFAQNKMANQIKQFKANNNNDIQDSVINPLDAFNLSNTNINNLNITNTTILGNNTSYMNEINNFIGKENGFQKKQRNNNNRMGSNAEFNRNGSYNNNHAWDNPYSNLMNQILEQPEFVPKKPKNNIKRNAISNNPEPRKKSGFKGGGKPDPKGKNKSKGNASKTTDKESTTKSKFLLHHYPNGSGPDTDLIEMLEREVIDTNPNVSFEDIAELDSAKNALQEAVLLPLLIPHYFKGIRRPWKGILLYGPPGTGKTMLAKALATKGKTTFFNVHSSSFASKWRGESEKLVRILFEMARFYAPTTIFIDEVDSLCSKRGESGEGEGSRRVKAEILVQMDGISSITSNDNPSSNTNTNPNTQSIQDISKSSEANGASNIKMVTVMAATNRPWDLDDALRRRFEKRIYIPLPNVNGREQLFKINLKNIKLTEGVNYSLLVDKTNGYSGADISNVCREAAFMPMRRNWEKNKNSNNLEEIVSNPKFREDINVAIDMKDLLAAINNISKSVSKSDLDVYDNWTKEFGAI